MSNKLYEVFHKGTTPQSRVISGSNFTYRILLNHLDKIILGKKLNILDYGCGAGTLSFYCGQKGSKVLGADISKKAIQAASKSVKFMNASNVNFIQIKPMQVPVGNFDLIICTEVIEHVKDDIKLIRMFEKRLKKKGKLFLTTPSINAPLHKLGLAKSFDMKVGHLRRYDPSDLREMINSAGFNINKLTKAEGILRNSFFLIPRLGFLVRFIKGPISDLVTWLDDMTMFLFGESDLIVEAQKK